MTERKRLDVQGLRALAIIAVVAFHGRLGVLGGFTGVDVFFVISGFVISGSLIRELERGDRLDVSAFYRRRVKRLLPALAVMLTIVALAGMLLAPVAAVHMSGVTAIAASFFAANWYLYSLPTGYFDPTATLNPLLHTWTLAVEEQFYLVYPLLLMASWRLGTRGIGRRLCAGLIVGLAAIGSLLAAARWQGGGDGLAFYGSPSRAWEFAVGCLIALSVPRLERLSTRASSLIAAAGTALLAFGIAYAHEDGSLFGNVALPVLGTSLLIIAGCAARPLPSRVLASRIAVWFGDRSYSWYLWHWPLIVFAGALFPGADATPIRIAAVLSLIPAWLSYRYVETRFRANAAIAGRRAIVLAAVCVEAAVVAALVQLHFPVASAQAAGHQIDRARGCGVPLTSSKRPLCSWLTSAARGTVVLVGDSNAGHFADVVVAAARRNRLNAVVGTESGCPFLQAYLANGALDYRACMHSNRVMFSWLLRHHPRLVIISMRSDLMLAQPAWGFGLHPTTITHDQAGKTMAFEQSLRREVTALTRVGARVILVHPVPNIGLNEQACAVVLRITGGCAASQPRTAVDAELRPALLAEKRALQHLQGVSLLDLENALCSTARCSTSIRGIDVYSDRTHLTTDGSLLLTPTFLRAMSEALGARR